LADSPHLACLTELDLHGNEIGETGALALAGSPHLARLTSLDLVSNQIEHLAAVNLSEQISQRRP